MIRVYSILLATLLLTACGAMVQNPDLVSDPGARRMSIRKRHRIQLGDELEVRFFYNPELNDRVIVRPDGYIWLQLVGELGPRHDAG